MCLYVHISVCVYTYMLLCIHTYGFMLSDMCLYDGLMHVNRYVECWVVYVSKRKPFRYKKCSINYVWTIVKKKHT